jgi:uncharacterized protein YggT (Ycf19 family)
MISGISILLLLLVVVVVLLVVHVLLVWAPPAGASRIIHTPTEHRASDS